MGKKYSITVDGVVHIVEVNEYNGSMPSEKVIQNVVSNDNNNVQVDNNNSQQPTTQNVVIGNNTVVAPLQGTLQDIKVSIGQTVKAGDVLLIIEAMKMENEIVAPNDGKITNIYIQKGAKVNSGDALLEIGD